MTVPSAPLPAATTPPPRWYRWLVLVLISLAMFGNYYIYDSISPLADVLKTQLGFSDADIGWLNAIYSIPNVFMVLIGGMIIDRIGTRRSTLIFALLCLVGAVITVSSGTLEVMAAGRLVFGLGRGIADRRGDHRDRQMVPGKGTQLCLRLEPDHRPAGILRRPEFPHIGDHPSTRNGGCLCFSPCWRESSALPVPRSTGFLKRAREKRFDLGKAGSTDKVVFADLFKLREVVLVYRRTLHHLLFGDFSFPNLRGKILHGSPRDKP